MNNLHLMIKFTFQHSTQEISFLDMKIHVGADRKLSTTLYRKPTDCTALLHFHSNPSLKCKESIVFSQALRYNLLIADDNILQKELYSLTISLLARKYLFEVITRNISKALLCSRDTLLYRTPRHQVPDLSSQLWPLTHQKEDNSPIQYKTIGISLRMIHNYTASGTIPPSLPTTIPNP